MGKIFIVDDAKFMRMTLTKIIEQAGHEVVGEAMTGTEAIEQFRRLKPDLVFMDITMPDMDGIQAVRAIVNEFPDAKIVMCSALGQQRMIVEAIEAGAKDFIKKPFDSSQIVDTIEKILNG